jgi:hypothetical protein
MCNTGVLQALKSFALASRACHAASSARSVRASSPPRWHGTHPRPASTSPSARASSPPPLPPPSLAPPPPAPRSARSTSPAPAGSAPRTSPRSPHRARASPTSTSPMGSTSGMPRSPRWCGLGSSGGSHWPSSGARS